MRNSKTVQLSSIFHYFFSRVPELLFQPSMIGNEQAGLAETVDYVLKKCSPEHQNALVQVSFFICLLCLFEHLAFLLSSHII